MYSAPLREKELPHQREREEWSRRLRESRDRAEPETKRNNAPPGLSGDAALVGLILFLLSDKTKGDALLLGILVYLLLN